MVMVKEPDEKPAAVIKRGTLEGVVQILWPLDGYSRPFEYWTQTQ